MEKAIEQVRKAAFDEAAAVAQRQRKITKQSILDDAASLPKMTAKEKGEYLGLFSAVLFAA